MGDPPSHSATRQLFHAHSIGADLPTLPRSGMEQNLFSQVLQVVEDQDNSPDLSTSGTALPPASGISGWGQGGVVLPRGAHILSVVGFNVTQRK